MANRAMAATSRSPTRPAAMPATSLRVWPRWWRSRRSRGVVAAAALSIRPRAAVTAREEPAGRGVDGTERGDLAAALTLVTTLPGESCAPATAFLDVALGALGLAGLGAFCLAGLAGFAGLGALILAGLDLGLGAEALRLTRGTEEPPAPAPLPPTGETGVFCRLVGRLLSSLAMGTPMRRTRAA